MKTTFASMDITNIPHPYIQNLWREDRLETGILRLDLIHPIVSGNKWFKLKYNLEYARQYNYTTLLTFGGAYSNHLIATAAAANEFGFKSIAIIRGHHAKESYTPTLQHCETLGMELHFISREEYKLKNDPAWLQQLVVKFPEAYIIPEGGNNRLGSKGAEEIAQYIPDHYTHVAVSVGSGTTFTGLRNALPETTKLLGFVPMKKGRYLASEMHTTKGNWQLIDNYHFGGFGKYTDELLRFMNDFYTTYQVPLDTVYTAKMLYGIKHLLKQGFFPAETKLLCIHTGGLQGNTSIKDTLLF